MLVVAVLTLLEDVQAIRAHAGTAAVIKSALAEAIFSTLMAPIVMLQHSWYVVTIIMGMATGWNAQTRTDRALPLGLVTAKFAPHTLIGAGAAFLIYNYVNDPTMASFRRDPRGQAILRATGLGSPAVP